MNVDPYWWSPKGWARVPAVQPVDKRYLSDLTGRVPAEVLDEVTAQILNYLGLIEPEAEEDDAEDEEDLF